MNNPLVSIILLNWNGDSHVHRCIEHLVSQSYSPLEVIVVDNGSVDGSIETIKRNHPQFAYVENSNNLGFAVGMNQGILASEGQYVIPLNQDVCMDRELVQKCVARAEADLSIGAIGGRVFSWVGDDLTNTLRRGEGERYMMRRRFQGDGGNFVEGECLTWGVSSSLPFLRRTMLEDLRSISGHYYDPSFVTGWEDGDLYFRMHLRGWKALFLSIGFWLARWLRISQRERIRSSVKSWIIKPESSRNRYFTIVKDLPPRIFLWLLPYLLTTEVAIIPYFAFRSPKSLIALVRAWKQVLEQMPLLLDKRAKIMDTMLIKPSELKRFLPSLLSKPRLG